MKKPNFINAIENSGLTKPGRVTGVIILHDAGCAHWRGLPCDCEPEVKPCDPATALRMGAKAGHKN
jgi:hypothetical protein